MKKIISMVLTVFLVLSIPICAHGEKGGFQKDRVTFQGLTVIDCDECVIRITGIEPTNSFDCKLKLNLENKSEDKTYRFSVRSAAVNGLQCETMFSAEVAAGKKAVDTMTFYGTGIEAENVDFSDIELTFKVYDSDSWTDTVALETVHVYPYGEENAIQFEFQQKESDIVIVDNEYVTAIVIGYDPYNLWGYTVNLFLRNKTDTEAMFSVDEASVNGYMVDPFWAESVIPGKCEFDALHFSARSLEEIGAEEVEEIEFVFRSHDYDDWFAVDYFNELVTLNP